MTIICFFPETFSLFLQNLNHPEMYLLGCLTISFFLFSFFPYKGEEEEKKRKSNFSDISRTSVFSVH